MGPCSRRQRNHPEHLGLAGRTGIGAHLVSRWIRDHFRHRSPQATDIWTVQPDGSNPTNITQTPQPEADERKPSYTGDGTTIVYERFGDIWKMSADGTGQANLTDDFSGGGLDPSASPSGERIVFTSSADNNEELFVMNADGTDITRLTSVAGEDENPDWQATDRLPGSRSTTRSLPKAATVLRSQPSG